MKKTVAEGLKIVEEESQFMAVDKNLTQIMSGRCLRRLSRAFNIPKTRVTRGLLNALVEHVAF